MTIAKGALPPRRRPASGAAQRYHSYVRASRARHARPPRRIPGLIAWALLALVCAAVLLGVTALADAGSSSLRRELEAAIARAFPAAITAPLELDRVGTVQAEPVVDQLPAFTSDPAVLLQGHVPSFATGEGRRVEIALNGAVVGRMDPDAAGRFAQRLELRDGENTIVVALLEGESAIATRSVTSVLDRIAPPLAIIRPVAGQLITGQTIVVEGTTEPGARVTVNGRVVVAAPDGAFSESYSASAGPQAIEVVALDPAGNETRSSFAVSVRAAPQVAGIAVALSLDRTRVRPGEPVVADVRILESGRPAGGVSVTLFAGLVEAGTSTTRSDGSVTFGFAAPRTEGEIAVIAIASSGSARATLTVSR